MAVATLKLAGREFVVIPRAEYLKLKKNGTAGSARKKPRELSPSEMTAQDWGDVAEMKRRLADPTDRVLPYAGARRRSGSK